VELEQGAVSGIGIRQEHCIWQVFREPIRICDRDHLVVDAIDDQYGPANALEVRKSLTGESLPLAKRRDLSSSDLGSRRRFAILRALRKAGDERLSRALTRFCRCEENFLQNGIAAQLRILQ
jgi:hypothetical protein